MNKNTYVINLWGLGDLIPTLENFARFNLKIKLVTLQDEKVVSEILSASEAHSRESLIAEVKKKMLDLISEKELDVCLHIINGMLDNPGQFKGADYEN